MCRQHTGEERVLLLPEQHPLDVWILTGRIDVGEQLVGMIGGGELRRLPLLEAEADDDQVVPARGRRLVQLLDLGELGRLDHVEPDT